MNSYALTRTTPSRWRVYQIPPPRHGRGGRIRTHDTRFWRPLLYQTELHPYYTKIFSFLKYPGCEYCATHTLKLLKESELSM